MTKTSSIMTQNFDRSEMIFGFEIELSQLGGGEVANLNGNVSADPEDFTTGNVGGIHYGNLKYFHDSLKYDLTFTLRGYFFSVCCFCFSFGYRLQDGPIKRIVS